jgi:hypothetical protein
MSIDEAGFLSPEVAKFREQIRIRWAEYFALAEKAGRLFHAQKFRFNVHNADPQEIFAVGLLLKLAGDIEAASLLIERGMYSQGRSMLRVAIECDITLAKVCESFEFGQAYATVAEQARLKLIKGLRKIDVYPQVKAAVTDEYVIELSDRLKGKPEKKLEQWASDAKMDGIYQGPYRLFCGDVHSDASSLSRFFSVNEAEEITGIEWGPLKREDCRAELLEVTRLYLGAMERTSKLFEVPRPEEATTVLREYERLGAIVAQRESE